TPGGFFLRGSDIYKGEGIERLEGPVLPKPPRKPRLAPLRQCCDQLLAGKDLGTLLDTLLSGLAQHFGIQHAMVLAIDEKRERFYTLASRGYDTAGVGSEIPVGVGTGGVAAARGTPIRLTHAAAEYAYVRGIRDRIASDEALRDQLESKIPFPGLRAPMSQLSVPIEAGDRVLGVLHVESAEQLR